MNSTRRVSRLVRQLVEDCGRPVAVAGSVGPTGDLLAPLGDLDHRTAVAVFEEQIEALARAGVDVVWIETLSCRAELEAAYEAARVTQIPVVATMSFDTHGKTMMGFAPGQFGAWSQAQTPRPAAIGANCGVGAGDVVLAVRELAEAHPGAPIVAKANCGLPAYTEGHLRYPHGPDTMPAYVELALRAGARVIGACCGSGPGHIAAIRNEVDCSRAKGGSIRRRDQPPPQRRPPPQGADRQNPSAPSLGARCRCQVSGVRCQVSGVRCQVSGAS